MTEEIWKDVKGYEGRYKISNLGRVKSLHYLRSNKEKLLSINKSAKNGYYYVCLCNGTGRVKSAKIHRMVAEAFIPNPQNKRYINHKDGNKHNNFVGNLEWVTPLENNLHAYHVLHKHPMHGYKYDKNKNSRKVEQWYISDKGYKYHIATYANAVIASKINGLSQRSICSCCNHLQGYGQSGGYIWRYADE